MIGLFYPPSKTELEETAAYIKKKLAKQCPLLNWRVDLDPPSYRGEFLVTAIVDISNNRIFAQRSLSLQEMRLIDNWDERLLYQLAGALTEKIMTWRPDNPIALR